MNTLKLLKKYWNKENHFNQYSYLEIAAMICIKRDMGGKIIKKQNK